MLQDSFVDALMNKHCILESHVAPDSLKTRHALNVFYGWREHVSNQKRYDGLRGNLELVYCIV